MTDDNFVNISGGKVQGFIQENYGTVTQNFINQYAESYSGQAPGAEKLTQVEYRQRQVLLSKVKEYWIEGVLNKSLHTKAMIELGLEKRSDAVKRPFNGFEELPEESRQILPTGTDATEVFNQIGEGRTLLILGEPGAGKTITLLKLAQNLIARAQENVSRLIPVVFNLSSWGSKQPTIADWLVEELSSKYQVSKALGKDWVKNQQLLLLLDGLDEVKANLREACVEAINQFMQEHGQTEMVVCSRIADYEVLSNRLQLRGAIYIRSLTPEQVNQYLDAAGEQLEAVKTLLTDDTALQELAKSPLTLSVMTLAYQGKKVGEILQTGSVEERREHLFDAYIERMFKRKGINQQYQKDQAIHWLTWLAQRMTVASQTIFLIERLQPSWLSTKGQRIRYRWESAFIGGLSVVMFYGLIYGLIFGPIFGLVMGLVMGLIFGLIVGFLGDIKTFETLKWSWQEARNGFRKGWIVGLIVGLILGLIVGLIFGLTNRLIVGLIFGLIFGLIVGLIGGLIGGLISGLISGFRGPEIQQSEKPNQGIFSSARNAVIFGLICGLITGLITTGLSQSEGLIFGLHFGLIGGLIGGGSACIRHFALRLMLYRKGYAPWNYARFLDYASERIFLQKVGGGYIFVHRMLLEHFAQMK